MFQKSIVQRWNELNPEVDEKVERASLPPRTRSMGPKLIWSSILAAAAVVFVAVLAFNYFEVVDSQPATPVAQIGQPQILKQLVLELDKARNIAIQFRDVGLISEYADQLSPIYSFDKKLIETMINDDIVIQDVKYAVITVEQISLRRSGTSQFMRLRVSDTRSEYKQIISGKRSTIPERIQEAWELELYRQSGSQKWTLWSAQKTKEPQP